MYLTFTEYTEYGGTLEETAFNDLEFQARSVIDWWTFNRLTRETEYPEAVKRCMFRLIKLIDDRQQAMMISSQSSDATKTAGIASESNDGVSTTYNTLSAQTAVDTLEKEMEDVIKLYLSSIRNSLGHNLLYRGIYPDE